MKLLRRINDPEKGGEGVELVPYRPKEVITPLEIKGTLHEREHKESSTFCGESKLFFALIIGLCHSKKNR